MRLTWKIEKLEVRLQENKLHNIVVSACWHIEALDEREDYRQREYEFGKTTFEPPSSVFIEFNNLTEGLVLGWVYKALGQSQKKLLEQKVSEKLTAAQKPNVFVKPLPW